MKRLVIMGALALTCVPTMAAVAAKAPPTATVAGDTEERLALAGKMLAAMGFERQFDAIIPQVVAMMMPMLSQGNVGKEEVVRTILSEEMAAAMQGRRADFVANAQQVYARNFTRSELADMLAFYSSPTGKAVAEKTPKIAVESMQGGAEVGRKAAQDALPRIIGRMRAAQLEVPKGT